MTTLEMEIAVIKNFRPRQNLIVPNVSWGLHDQRYKSLHECDVLILSNSNYATEIEIKISKSDLLNDLKKRHKHNHDLIRRFYYAVPEKLEQAALENIPNGAGLLVVYSKQFTGYKWHTDGGKSEYVKYYTQVKTVKECTINTVAVKWTNEQRQQLARLGTMRILGLKEKIHNLLKK
jgi:hypothetical protein